MSKRSRNDGPGRVFHVTGRVNWRAWHLTKDAAKLHLVKLSRMAAAEYGVSIFAYALMDNHFHQVVQSPDEDLFRRLTSRRTPCRHRVAWPPGHQKASVLAQFMRKVRSGMSRARHRELGLSGHFWEGRYDARPIQGPLSLAIRIAYDHRNPVKAGIVGTPEDYRWSSARPWVTGQDADIPVQLERFPFDADPAALHRDVLLYQNTSALDAAEGLARLLQARSCTLEEIATELRESGITVRSCGSRSANG